MASRPAHPSSTIPHASPYVVGAGGTTLLATSTDAYDIEITWYAGGGGISQFESAPASQVTAGIPSATELNSRGIPDVSMDADPYSRRNVYVNGAVEQVGGTSCSCPAFARRMGAHDLRQLQTGLRVVAPVWFVRWRNHAWNLSCRAGSTTSRLAPNGLFTALPGWDYTTGLGSLWVSQSLHKLEVTE